MSEPESDPAEEAIGPPPREETLRRALAAACQEILRQDKILSSRPSETLRILGNMNCCRSVRIAFRVACAAWLVLAAYCVTLLHMMASSPYGEAIALMSALFSILGVLMTLALGLFVDLVVSKAEKRML